MTSRMDLAEDRLRKAGDVVEKKKRLVELLRAGESQSVIAERLGVTTRTLKYWVKELGLKKSE